MSIQPPEDNELGPSLMLNEDGEVVPRPKGLKDKKRLQKHLSFAKKTARKHQKNRSQNKINKKKRVKTANAAEDLKQYSVLTAISSLADEKVNLVASAEVKEALETSYSGILEEKIVGWSPFPGPQSQFLEADEFEVLFSGGRAPGKSDALMMDPLRYCGFKDFRGLVVRKAMKELRDLIKRAKELYPLCYPGTKWKEQEKLFVFPSGATIEFGYCDHEDDVDQYKGQEYSWLGIDELTEIAKEETYEKLIMSVRKGGEGFKTYVRATTNPNGAGKSWVKKRFVDQGPQNKSIVLSTNVPGLGEIKTSRKWIHGTVFDNPKILKENPQYVAMLANIDNEVLRKQWLEGDWDSADGLAFDEFSRKTHVIEPFEIPSSWFKFRACDWGYKTKAAILWFAVDFEGRIYVYRELITGGGSKLGKMLAKDVGNLIQQIESAAGEKVRYGILDASAWSQRGENAPPPAEDMAGLTWRPSDRTPHSRITGKLQVHKFLQIDEEGRPGVYIFNTCTDLISCLSSLPIDKNNPEDVDTKVDDHSYDAFRYGLMSRPIGLNNYDFQFQQSEPPPILNPSFGF